MPGKLLSGHSNSLAGLAAAATAVIAVSTAAKQDNKPDQIAASVIGVVAKEAKSTVVVSTAAKQNNKPDNGTASTPVII